MIVCITSGEMGAHFAHAIALTNICVKTRIFLRKCVGVDSSLESSVKIDLVICSTSGMRYRHESAGFSSVAVKGWNSEGTSGPSPESLACATRIACTAES